MRRLFGILGAFVVLFAPLASRADVLDTPLPIAAWTKTVGTLQVQRYGSGSPALILVPGLACGPWSFQETIAHEAKTHTIYALTLAGFDGTPIGTTPSLGAAEASLVILISSEKIDRPVLIGHSMGGTLALRFGEDRPDLVRGVVSVDGLPISPRLPLDADPATRAAAAGRFTDYVASQAPAAFSAAAAAAMNDYVTDPTLAKHAATLAARSDQQAVARYGGELQSTDLRPNLPKLTAPVLFVAPIPSLPLPSYLPAEMASLTDEQRLGATLGFYQPMLAGAPNLKIVPVINSRHFVMLDQPAAFDAAIDGFMATLK